jgi:hypothetical protein
MVEIAREPLSQIDDGSAELEALCAAIASTIDAMVEWDILAFESAVLLQSEICCRIGDGSRIAKSARNISLARKVRHLSRVCARMLEHSIRWTHTLRAILGSGAQTADRRTTVHFRG